MNKWEYLTVEVAGRRTDLQEYDDEVLPAHLQQDLNVVGKYGWELVGILENRILILKRPAPEPSSNYPEFRHKKGVW